MKTKKIEVQYLLQEMNDDHLELMNEFLYPTLSEAKQALVDAFMRHAMKETLQNMKELFDVTAYINGSGKWEYSVNEYIYDDKAAAVDDVKVYMWFIKPVYTVDGRIPDFGDMSSDICNNRCSTASSSGSRRNSYTVTYVSNDIDNSGAVISHFTTLKKARAYVFDRLKEYAIDISMYEMGYWYASAENEDIVKRARAEFIETGNINNEFGDIFDEANLIIYNVESTSKEVITAVGAFYVNKLEPAATYYIITGE